MKKLNRDMKRLSKRTEKAFKSASNVVVDVFTTPPPQTIKKIRKRNKKTREEICTSIERLNQEMVEFSNNLCIRIVESLNKDLATGKPLRPFYDDVENVPLTHAYIVQQETLKKEDNSWRELLSTAIEERDYEAITTNFAYIREVTDFYFYFQAQEGQDNLLHYAARDNDIVLATAIYDTWLRIFASNLDTEMMASRESRIQIMIALCPMWGSIVDGCNAQGWTALHCAASHGHKDMVEWLLMRYAAREAVTKRGSSALMLAVMKGHEDVVEYLYEKGADITLQDFFGETAISLAKDNEVLLDILQESEDIMSTRSRRCVVCYDKLQNVLLRPCRHMVYCTDCADKAKFHHVNCPTCRASIDETVIVHYS